MLRRLSANHEEFQEISFVPGVNLILADRAPDASDQHTRNARGKTSVIQAINFCLGSNKPASFQQLGDEGWSFTLEMDLFDGTVAITRDLGKPSRAHILTDRESVERRIAPFRRDDKSLSIDDLKVVLGEGLFGLPSSAAIGTNLSFRALSGYVIRTEASKDPTKTIAQQSASNSRSCLSYLLGLQWETVGSLNRLERDQAAFDAISYAAEQQLVPGLVPDEGNLAIERIRVERELQVARTRAADFVVLEDPGGVVAESNSLAETFTSLSDEQVADRRLIKLYESSLAGEEQEPAATWNLQDLYQELGLAFTPAALRRFEDVETFHETLWSNRRHFLSSELTRLKRAVEERAPRLRALNERRKDLARKLALGGAAEDLLELQQNVSALEAQLTRIDEAIELSRRTQAGRDDLKVLQATLVRDAREELSRDRGLVDRVNAAFADFIDRLYGQPGSITVDVDKRGYKFGVKVAAAGSTGISKMQLFAFDLALLEVVPPAYRPDFLIHDSVVFDGVDPRQIEIALRLAHQSTLQGKQYIATMNTNDVPPNIASEGWYPSSVCRIILDTEEGGAFGVSFGR